MRRILPFTLLFALVSTVHAYMLPDQALYHYRCKNCLNLSHKTVSTNWLIEDKTMVPAEVKPVISKRFYRQISGKELKQGVELGVLADGAVIRVTPLQPKQLSANWQTKFVIQTTEHNKPLAEMVQSIGDEQGFKKQFAVGPALIFQLKPGLVKQRPRIGYNDTKLDDGSKWQLSVYDKLSDLYLSVALDNFHYQLGQTVNAVIYINDYAYPEVNWLEARIIGPNSQGMMVDIEKDGMFQFHGAIPINTKRVAQGENWYFMVLADITVNGSHTFRTAQVPFSYVVPSAKIRSIYRPSSDQPLSLKASVETVQASRYQLQAVVYATGDDGDIHPVALAQTSAWIEPGVKELPLEVDKSLPSNMHSPYYLGQIELVDDASAKPVYIYNEQIPLSKLDV